MARLLWLSHVLPHPPKGGVLQRSYHLIRGAAEVHDVDVVSFRQRAFHPDLESLSASVEALSAFANVRAVVDLPVDRGPWARGRELAASAFAVDPYTVRWNRTAGMRDAVAALDGSAYDLVHFDAIGMFQYRHAFPRSAWVLNHHNVESQMMRRRVAHAPLPARPYLWWEAVRLRRWERVHGSDADLHLVVSRLDGERLAEVIPGARAQVVENAVDTEFFRPGGSGPRRRGRVVFVGRIDAYANLSAVRWLRDEIWPRVREIRPDASLAIVGRNPPREVVEWGAGDAAVEVTGFVDDVRRAFDEAEVFVCPIFEGGGTRLKVLDAMAMGLPVVSHEMAVEGLDVVPGEHVLVARDGPGLAREVLRLLEDPALRTRMGEAARTRVDGLYSTRAVHKHLAEAYARSLESSPRRSR